MSTTTTTTTAMHGHRAGHVRLGRRLAGAVTPSIDRTYSLDRVPEAMRHLEAGKARGKVAIAI